MITRRIAQALRKQEWATILIEFVLVVVGILLALQLDQWNDIRKDNARELELLKSVRTDIREDIRYLQNADDAMSAVLTSGATVIANTEREQCVDDCWSTLVAFFLASQWIDVSLLRSTYDEIRTAGLPRDAGVAFALSRYYALGDQGTKINAELPLYRSLVRSAIPAAVQQYMWAHCHSVDGRLQFLQHDCAPPENTAGFQGLVANLGNDPELMSALNYWLSTVTVVRSTLADQVAGGEMAIAQLTNFIGDDG